jgi:hypothetical protein
LLAASLRQSAFFLLLSAHSGLLNETLLHHEPVSPCLFKNLEGLDELSRGCAGSADGKGARHDDQLSNPHSSSPAVAQTLFVSSV